MQASQMVSARDIREVAGLGASSEETGIGVVPSRRVGSKGGEPFGLDSRVKGRCPEQTQTAGSELSPRVRIDFHRDLKVLLPSPAPRSQNPRLPSWKGKLEQGPTRP